MFMERTFGGQTHPAWLMAMKFLWPALPPENLVILLKRDHVCIQAILSRFHCVNNVQRLDLNSVWF